MSTDLTHIAGGVENLSALREFLNRLHAVWNEDPEVAHGLEDDIKSRALKLVADGHPDAREIARDVLAMDGWDDVERWYA